MKKYMPKLKNNKLKILILAPVIYMSPTKFGDKIYAPRDYILTLAEGLKKKGHEVILFSTPDLKTEVPLEIDIKQESLFLNIGCKVEL